ncbi:hypothetical protein [Megasphaera elsdenii]|uniref:hypothetical protein n=1 Tax=Megasphaera elsdenii TaxID=907 RepID=UPI003D044DF5
MEMTNKWAYALGDEEDYNGVFFDSKEAALEEAMDDARQYGYSTVWVGQVQSFRPVVMIADELFDRLQDQDELNDAIETVFFAWMKAHPEYKPNFFTIADSQSYKVGDEK